MVYRKNLFGASNLFWGEVLGYRAKKAGMKKAKLSKSQDLMFTLCDNPEKEKFCKELLCTIECFNVYNPGMARALNDPNSAEAKHYGAKIQAKAKALGS